MTIRLCILCEGRTEENVVNHVLQPYLFSIYPTISVIVPINLNGSIVLGKVCKRVSILAESFDYVTTLIDFYGLAGKRDNPTKVSVEKFLCESVSEYVQNKFIPYVQMYELEGLLFSDPEILSNTLGIDNAQWALKILNQFNGNPESINNSPATATSKRLEVHEYLKTVHAHEVLRRITITKIRSICVGFDDWLTRIEQRVNQ